ncbi:hypothetical protein [Cyanobium sp. Morenito 9A2]|uniref:hypothetical protein n=1 Tax=Cyanobium sp. Morenito 9A2 TaxID=2823718 RepID=UPI0020CB754C|nr:hypothetical protein [Cyanobium sp. Morenito 9A2]MCP9851228.1 hypothetical protein [Cyanobium sp. Morenito 9A2]
MTSIVRNVFKKAKGRGRLPSAVRFKSLVDRKGLAICLILTSAYAVYFFGIARSRYVSSIDLFIRGPEKAESSTALNAISALVGKPNQDSSQDARYLVKYLQSPQLFQKLDQKLNLRKIYAIRSPDIFSGVPNGIGTDSLLSFYKNNINLKVDDLDGTLSIATTAFSPKDAYNITFFLKQQSEDFVNTISQGISKSQLIEAKKEIDSVQSRLVDARSDLLKYQIRNNKLSAKAEADTLSSLISGLTSELVKLKVELSTLRRRFNDPNAPEVRDVQDQILSLEDQISAERRRALRSTSSKNLTNLLFEEQALESKILLTQDLYKLALTSAETSRILAQSQVKYLVALSDVYKPIDQDTAWRVRNFFLFTLATFLIYIVFASVRSIVYEHRY